jgi:hypothetical protein
LSIVWSSANIADSPRDAGVPALAREIECCGIGTAHDRRELPKRRMVEPMQADERVERSAPTCAYVTSGMS